VSVAARVCRIITGPTVRGKNTLAMTWLGEVVPLSTPNFSAPASRRRRRNIRPKANCRTRMAGKRTKGVPRLEIGPLEGMNPNDGGPIRNV